MDLSTSDNNKLRILADKLDNLLSDINLEMRLMNQSKGIEYLAFLFTLDIDELRKQESNLSVNYNRNIVLNAVHELRDIFQQYRFWYLDGELVSYVEWKRLYNIQAVKWKATLLA